MAKGHIFYRKAFCHFVMCGSSGRRAMRYVRLGVMSSAHISTAEHDTSWLPEADTHNKMYFYLLCLHGVLQK